MGRIALCLGWLSCCGWIAAGEGARPEDAFLFTIYDAATSAKIPQIAGDGAAELKPAQATVDGRKLTRLQVRFRPEQQYTALECDAAAMGRVFSDPDLPVQPQEVVVAGRATRGSTLVVRIADADDLMEAEVAVAEDGWRLDRLPIGPDLRGWKALKRGDGSLRTRLRMVSVGLRAGQAPTATLDLERIALLPSPKDVAFTTRVPGNLFVTGERPVGAFDADGGVRVRVEDAWGGVVQELDATSGEVALPAGFGWYAVRARLPGWRPGSAGSYAVIPDNRVAGKEPNSPFGINCHYGNYWYKPVAAEIAKRIGIGWIRDGHAAKDTSAADDKAYENAEAQGLCYFPHFAWGPKSREDNRRPDGSYDFTPVVEQQKAYASGVGAAVDCYDMLNEPDLHWMRIFGGDRTSGLWIDVYARFFAPAFQRATQAADPRSTVFWEGGLKQAEAYFERAPAGSIGGISPHSYAHKSKPEDHGDLNGGYAGYAEFLRRSKLRWPIWVGELGFTTFIGTTEHYVAVSELDQAGQLVRALVLNLAHGAEKVFYYDLVEWTMATWKGDPANDAFNCEFHFGIVRKDHSPKPAIAAYANLIAQTKGCRWLGRAKLRGGGQVHGYVFQRGEDKPGLVAWMRTGTAMLELPASAQVCDVFGRQVEWRDGSVQLSEVPLWISGWTPEVEAIPTYALLPRLHDPTAVQVGPGYGRTRIASKAKAAPTPPAVRPAPAPAPVPTAEGAARWDGVLLAAVRERLQRRRNPAFRLEALRQSVRIEGIDGDTVQGRIGVEGQFTFSWRKLTVQDRLDLALALLADGSDGFDQPGNALVAYHARVAGQEDLALQYLQRAGAQAAQVQSAFPGTAAAR